MRKTFVSYSLLFLMFALVAGLFGVTALAQTPLEQKQDLEKQLQEIELQIRELESELKTTQNKKNTLTNAIKQLKNQQANLRLQIKQTNIKIEELDEKMTSTRKNITDTRGRITLLKKDMGVILRLLNQKDQEILLETLSRGDLGEAFLEVRNYAQITITLGAAVEKAQAAERQLNGALNKFTNQQEDARHLLIIKGQQQIELANSLGKQKTLLQQTEGQEDIFEKNLTYTREQANAIRGRLYELLGGGKQISFGEALEIAQWVSGITRVRPAFLLAVITQESNLGKNVGTCNRLGDPPEKSYKVIMKPTRDIEPFLQITKELGRDPETTPVSCPMRRNGEQIGWGGAMGPAQFIPSTWMGYRDKVKEITGRSADPWDIRDAFLASGIKLGGGGADQGTEQGEWEAAMRYFAGSIKLQYRFYGDNVMERAREYQKDIDALKQN